MTSAARIIVLAAALATGCSDAPAMTAPELIGVDMDKVQPPGATIRVDRLTDGPIQFSVAGAVQEGIDLHAYWFVDFSFDNSKKPDGEIDTFTLDPCGQPLMDIAGFQKIVTIEALITEGELFISLDKPGDPRSTMGGEPIVPIRWTVVADGKCAQ